MPIGGSQPKKFTDGPFRPADRRSQSAPSPDRSARLLSRTEVEAQFGIPKRFLETAVARGDGPPLVRVGRLVRYKTTDIETWIDSVRVAPSSAA